MYKYNITCLISIYFNGCFGAGPDTRFCRFRYIKLHVLLLELIVCWLELTIQTKIKNMERVSNIENKKLEVYSC
jgi:hypothetical protein